jgi:hypothetical protein
MSRQSSDTFRINAQPTPRVQAAIDERGLGVLTEPELMQVAAAGSKPGVSPGPGPDLPPHKPL